MGSLFCLRGCGAGTTSGTRPGPHPAAGPEGDGVAPSFTGGHGTSRRILVIAALYGALSILFTWGYFARTDVWMESDLLAYTVGGSGYPGHHTLFEGRVLVPLIARLCMRLGAHDVVFVYRAVAVLSVLLALETYRRYLSSFVEDRRTSALASAILYPMAWNLCLLNRIYFPFDLPAIPLFILGLHLLHARRWAGYYTVLAIGVLNHEAMALLVLVSWFSSRGSRDAATRWHVLTQIMLVVGVKCGVWALLGWHAGTAASLWKARTYLAVNAGVLRDMVTLQGDALRDWAKLVLAFGGAWLALPLVLRRAPDFLRAAVWAGVAYTCFVGVTAIIDEVRSYGVLMPVVLTPVLRRVALRHGDVAPRAPDAG